MTARYDTIIIGGGLAGVTSAYTLAKAGQSVLLLEAKDGLAQGASYANGGMVTPSMPDPWNGPGVGKHLFQSLFDPTSPMKLRPKAIPGLTRWGLAFLRNSMPARHRHAIEANYALADYSAQLTHTLAQEMLSDAPIYDSGVLKVFEDEVSFQSQLANAKLLGSRGLKYHVLSPQEVVEREPVLGGAQTNLRHGIYYSSDLSGDAHLFTNALGQRATDLSVEICRQSPVMSFVIQHGRVVGVKTAHQQYLADHIVLAAGAHTPALARKAGLYFPIKPAKGYSVTLAMHGWNQRPTIPIVDDAMHAAVTPLGDYLRVVGTAEFTGFDPKISQDRIDNLLALFKRLYPDLERSADTTSASSWAGFRPMSADGIPFIGRTKRSGLWVNAGHGHLGWTMAMGSAALLTDAVLGKTPAIDMAPYAPVR
ncbi:MAG: FAD-dependent oxidoreductase [Pseudomonadota bacterium]